MRLSTVIATAVLLVGLGPRIADCAGETNAGDPDSAPEPESQSDEGRTDQQLSWRCDPEVLRHPGSYIGGGIGYVQSRAWVDENEDHADLEFGPLHSLQLTFRVGDALTEWFAVGFQIEMMFDTAMEEQSETIGAFVLYLDITFYPFEGLGLRPSFGLGMGYAMGEKEYDFGFGGPGSLGFALLYEIRILRLLVVAPVAQVYWITSKSEGFDALFLFFGLEVAKWFDTPTG